jgi:ATP-binding cassette subfamily F protein uup
VIQAKADKLLAQEEIWIRKGVEARRTRAQARIVRLGELRAKRQARRAAVGSVSMDVNSGAASGKLVAELTHVSKTFGERRIVDDFSATILRGDKIGLLGPNGAGKTTLLKLILGELKADPAPAHSPSPSPATAPGAPCARAPTSPWPISTRCAMRWTSMPRWRIS